MSTAIGQWLPLVTALAACNTATVLPPEDDRALELVETALWSGGEVRVVVRHSDHEEDPVAITVDGDALAVVRVDDTTFAAVLPVHTGALPIRVDREGLAAIVTSVTLHGYVSGILGPKVAGPVVTPGIASSLVVLGSTSTGAAEVSLETGIVVRSWPLAVHSLVCGFGVVPGPAVEQVLLRPMVGGVCQPSELHDYTPSGLGPVIGTTPGSAGGITAIVGPWTLVLGRHDNSSQFTRCHADPAWSGCQPLMDDIGFSYNVRGWVAGYNTQRIFALGIKSALHDLLTGDVVTILPHSDDGVLYYHSAAFSTSEDTLYVAAFRVNTDDGKILLLDSETGATLDEVEIGEGRPLAIALDAGHGRILVLMHHARERRLWLRVLDAGTHAVLADLVAPSGEIETAAWVNESHRLVLEAGGKRVFAVSTYYEYSFGLGPVDVPRMAIARWTLK